MGKLSISHGLKLDNDIPVGTLLLQRGRRYVCVGYDDHTTPAGKATILVMWKGNCADCGAVFVSKTTFRPKALSVRCGIHKKAGKRSNWGNE